MAAKGKRAAIIQIFMNWCIYFSQCMDIVVHGASELKAEASFRFQKQERISEVLAQLWTIFQISIVGWHSRWLIRLRGIEQDCFYHFSYTAWFLKQMTSHMSLRVFNFSVASMASSSCHLRAPFFAGCVKGSYQENLKSSAWENHQEMSS